MRRNLLLLLALLLASASEAKKRPTARPTPVPAAPPAAAPVEPTPPVAPTAPGAEAAAPAAPPTTPAASPSPASTAPTSNEDSSPPVDLESLTAEYNAIRDELFQSRAKAAMLGEALLKTQLTVYLRYEAQRAWPLKKVTLKLDDRPVYSSDSLAGNEWTRLIDSVASPGRHRLSAHVEAAAAGDDRVAYATDGTFLFDVVDGKQTRVRMALDETGSGPQALGKKKEGTFDLRLKAEIKILDRGAQ